jgi:hypothetical protein
MSNDERRDPQSTPPLLSRRLRTRSVKAASRNFWAALDFDAEVEWLRNRSDDDYSGGIDATGWEESIWILHSMYEASSIASSRTHDDAHRSALDAGLAEPTVINERNLDEKTILTGSPLGFSEHPGLGWSRLHWSELAGRLNLRLDEQKYPPCFRWFPYSGWPISIRPPAEGSLDSESLDRLIPYLTGGSSSATCIAAHSFFSGGCDNQRQRCFAGPVGRLRDFVDGDEWQATFGRLTVRGWFTRIGICGRRW